jgi:N-acetylmuramoyl-L-alanine amidase
MMRSVLIALSLALLAPCQAAMLSGARTWAAPDNTRVVFDLSGPVSYGSFTLSKPSRVVLDLHDTSLAKPLPKPLASNGFLSAIRTGVRGSDLRLVLDVKASVTAKAFLLTPERPYGHRLVVDLIGREPLVRGPDPSPPEAEGARELVVAIDAGHGGEDPGAIGRRGVMEKHVVLAIARKLGRLIRREPGMRAVLIRDGDYFVGLRERIRHARAHKADLFVSIHADAFRDHRASGSSVYILSTHGASSEAARWLAERENASDRVGGVSLDDKDERLKAVLLDLSQTGTLEASAEVGEQVLHRLRRFGKVHHPMVQQAGFAVLKSPDIPSILVETAFITNLEEERRLSDPRHQQALAEAILGGVRAHFNEAAPPGTLLALRKASLAEARAQGAGP